MPGPGLRGVVSCARGEREKSVKYKNGATWVNAKQNHSCHGVGLSFASPVLFWESLGANCQVSADLR